MTNELLAEVSLLRGKVKKYEEAWKKIEKEIDDSILICRESAQNNIWCDGELAGFLQSKDIINENLSEVNNANSN